MQGEICDIDGTCVDAAEDELFKLTTKEGKIAVEREVSTAPATSVYAFPAAPACAISCAVSFHLEQHLQEPDSSHLARLAGTCTATSELVVSCNTTSDQTSVERKT